MGEDNARRPDQTTLRWMFSVEVTDPIALRAFHVDWQVDKDGELEGIVEWDSLAAQAGLRLMEIAIAAWKQAESELGVKFLGGGWPMPFDIVDPPSSG